MYKMQMIMLSKKQRSILQKFALAGRPAARRQQPAVVTGDPRESERPSHRGSHVASPANPEQRSPSDQNRGAGYIPLRAYIILATAEGRLVKEIAEELGVSPSMIYIWRRRWRDMANRIAAAEQKAINQDDDRILRRTIQAVLGRASDRSTSAHVSDDQLAQIIELTEYPPRAFGVDVDFWTMKTLAKTAMQRGIVEQISANKLSYLLRAVNFEPSL